MASITSAGAAARAASAASRSPSAIWARASRTCASAAIRGLPVEPPSARLLSAHGLRLAGRWLAPVETLEKMAELRAANHGRLSDEALTDLGWRADQAKQVIAALKVERARLPDKPGAAPKIVKDSPFAALAVLTEAPPARPKRRRPRRKAKA